MMRIHISFNFWKLPERYTYMPENELYYLFEDDSHFRNEQNKASRVNLFLDFQNYMYQKLVLPPNERKATILFVAYIVQF